MNIEEFSVKNISRNSTLSDYLKLRSLPAGNELKIPLLMAKGDRDGPVLSVLAGVHGNEFAGMQAIRNVFSRLDTGVMRGVFIGIPVLNPPAFQAKTRTSPIDDLNLARTFPGDKGGTVSELIAYYGAEKIIAPADFLIDLHTGGAERSYPLFCGYSEHGYENEISPQVVSRSKAASLAFGAAGGKVVVGSTVKEGVTKLKRGTTIEEATSRSIPSMFTESAGGGWLRPEAVSFYTDGIINVMKHMDMLPEEPVDSVSCLHLVGPGYGVTAPRSGFLIPRVDFLEQVKSGQTLGRLVGMGGDDLGKLETEYDGWVIMKKRNPLIFPGELGFWLVVDEN